MDLTRKKCVPCEGGTKPFVAREIKTYKSWIDKSWKVVGGKKIERKFKFKDFSIAMKFVSKIASIAEQEQHHPDIYISYNKVTISLATHAIGGLSVNDFIMAAKIDKI